MTLVVCLHGGPGCGKSTIRAGTFYHLKLAGVNVEEAPEFAKDKVWEEAFNTLENQIYVFGKQYHRLWRLLGKVDVIVTDSPLLLSLIYGKNLSPEFTAHVLSVFRSLDTHNILLTREKAYNPAGRTQTEEEARQVDKTVRTMLDRHFIPYTVMAGNEQAAPALAQAVISRLKRLESGDDGQ